MVPCVGWGGSKYGNRRQEGARGWDASQPEPWLGEVGESPLMGI